MPSNYLNKQWFFINIGFIHKVNEKIKIIYYLKLRDLIYLILKLRFDGLVKNLKSPSSVIPAQAGIQYFQVVIILWIPVPRLIPSRTSFTGMTTYYDSIRLLWAG
jgi:hypothetical protein